MKTGVENPFSPLSTAKVEWHHNPNALCAAHTATLDGRIRVDADGRLFCGSDYRPPPPWGPFGTLCKPLTANNQGQRSSTESSTNARVFVVKQRMSRAMVQWKHPLCIHLVSHKNQGVFDGFGSTVAAACAIFSLYMLYVDTGHFALPSGVQWTLGWVERLLSGCNQKRLFHQREERGEVLLIFYAYLRGCGVEKTVTRGSRANFRTKFMWANWRISVSCVSVESRFWVTISEKHPLEFRIDPFSWSKESGQRSEWKPL